MIVLATYIAGFKNGILHTIKDSEIWTVECPIPEFEKGDRDFTIWIELDGETYTHGIIQG